MKNSGVEWIGEIPDEWDIYRNKNAFICNKEIVGKNSKSTQLLSLTTGGIKCKDINNAEGKLPESFDTYQYVKKNDVVMCLFDLDMSAVFSGISQYDGMISPAYKVLSCQDRANPLFIHYWFSYIFDGRKFNHYAKNIRYTLNYNEFATLPILLPPKSTQQRIATYLDKKCSKIEETIQNQQQVIEKLKAYKQSLITEAVTGKIKIENGKACGEYESYKESGVEWIGKIPSEWEVKKLKYIADSFSKGSGITKEEIVINGDIPCVRYGELYTKYDYHFTECQTRTNLGIIETPKYFSHGDVLFTCTGELVEEIGKSITYLGNEKCLAGGDIIILKHSQDPMFMGFALDSKYVQGQKSFGKTKLKVVHISSGEIARLLIVLPPKEEQKEIADYLDKKCTAIDTAIEQKQKLIEKLTEYKKSLIYECVTGKRDIK
jgi:type I restriction enzyme S subunit